MILDKPEHKVRLLELIANTPFVGKAIDEVYELKQAVVNATVAETNAADSTAETSTGKAAS